MVVVVVVIVQVNLNITDSMGPGKLVRHMQNPLYTYDEYLICIGLGPSISSVICKNLSYGGPSYPSSPVVEVVTVVVVHIQMADDVYTYNVYMLWLTCSIAGCWVLGC